MLCKCCSLRYLLEILERCAQAEFVHIFQYPHLVLKDHIQLFIIIHTIRNVWKWRYLWANISSITSANVCMSGNYVRITYMFGIHAMYNTKLPVNVCCGKSVIDQTVILFNCICVDLIYWLGRNRWSCSLLYSPLR